MPKTKTTTSDADKNASIVPMLADTVQKLPLWKLFFILSIVGYIVIAFGQKQMTFDDALLYGGFLVFMLFITLHIKCCDGHEANAVRSTRGSRDNGETTIREIS